MRRSKAVFAGVVILTAVAGTHASTGHRQPRPEAKRAAIAQYGMLPLQFEANQGQTDEQVRFLARGGGYGLFLTSTESVLVLERPEAARPDVLRMRLVGANPRSTIEGRNELPGKSHYFVGNDPKRWRSNVAQYARVEYRDVYPGVGLVYYGNQGQLEYDFVVEPGADPGRIRLAIEGADAIRIDGQGSLRMSLPSGEVVQRAPVVYQDVDGARKVIDGRFVLKGKGEVGFEVGPYEEDRPLVLDPLLIYSSYLGGAHHDAGLGIAVDASRNIYVIGYTSSINFPTANPFQTNNAGQADVFVTKLNAAGSALVYSTYLGGSGSDEGHSIAVDTSGIAYLTGYTSSTDFPTANPLQDSNHGNGDAFVTKLDPSGGVLLYSTYLGGSASDLGTGVAVSAQGDAYLTGYTRSTDFPTVNAFQPESGGDTDAYVAELNATGSALVYSTYLGGIDRDAGESIAVDAAGHAYVTGSATSDDFPTANAFQAANAGGTDVFITRLSPDGTSLAYSTYLGGRGPEFGKGIAVDVAGNVYVTGLTDSRDFPTKDPFQPGHGGGDEDAFVTKLNPSGSALVYSTYLGGAGEDRGLGIAADASGNAYVVGQTSTTEPAARSHLPEAPGGVNAYAANLNAAGSALLFIYLRGNVVDVAQGVAVDASRNAYVTGQTESVTFPTVKPFQRKNGGLMDAFVAKIRFPTGTVFPPGQADAEGLRRARP